MKNHAAAMKYIYAEQHKANHARGAILSKKCVNESNVKITRIFDAEYDDKEAFANRRKQMEMKLEDETFDTSSELFIKPDVLMTHYLINGKISSKIDSGMNDDMLTRMKHNMHQICKREGMATDENDVIALQVER